METTWKEGPPEKPGIYALEWRAESGFSNTKTVYWNGAHARDLATDEAYRHDNISRHCPLTVSDPPPLPKPIPPRPTLFLILNKDTRDHEWAFREHDGGFLIIDERGEFDECYKPSWRRVEPQPKPPAIPPRPELFAVTDGKEVRWAYREGSECFDVCGVDHRVYKNDSWHRLATPKPPLPVELRQVRESISFRTAVPEVTVREFDDYCEKHFDCGDGK
jgi:hypothetical protein